MRRRELIWGAAASGLVFVPSLLRAQAYRASGAAPVFSTSAQIEVWKSPSCGCCADWVTHLESNGFRVKVNDVGNAAARARRAVPAKLGSCHTASVGGYAIEGHVPAADIHRLLTERPAAIGLAVPGMPVGSPGMDGPEYGGRRDAYQVLLIGRDGQLSVFNRYPSKEDPS
ncbi:MAG: hypothetical protein RL322_3094 [Pseudomonadota bacterium]|jgi:hypothetical protein